MYIYIYIYTHIYIHIDMYISIQYLSINYIGSVMWPIQWRVFFSTSVSFYPFDCKMERVHVSVSFFQRGMHHLKLFFLLTHFFLGLNCEPCSSGNFRQTVPQANYFRFFSFLSSAGPQNETQTTASCSKMCNFICRKWKQIHSPNKNQMLIKKPDIVHFCTTRSQRWKKNGT